MSKSEYKQSILVVDDDRSIRSFISALLHDFGTVELAESGEEALSKVEALNPDMIILDVQMPGMDGYETCRKLKENENTASIPVVFLTASSTNEDEELGLEVGATDFIRKPISPKILMSRAANVLNLQAATKKLEMLAATDPLTGAYNRRHFTETGDKELLRSRRHKHPFSVLMLDIDHFKAVNDTYGHDIGDEALKRTVTSILETLRTEDTLGRLGGEEFAVILPETGKEKGVLLAERIRVAISKIVVETSTDPLTFTMSIGISECQDEDEDINAALKRADAALYQAKEQGRNRVV